jgi:hypothetical protein
VLLKRKISMFKIITLVEIVSYREFINLPFAAM